MIPSYIVAPLVGGIIGYITNALAIRMLFRPHQPKYFKGHRLPFTPGIIPKEKGRIAASVGGAISENLMNEDVMHRSLLSDDMLSKIREAVGTFLNRQKRNPETLRQFLSHYLSEDEISQIAQKCEGDLTVMISKKLASSDVGDKIAHAAVGHVMSKMMHFGNGIGEVLKDNGIGHGGGFGDKAKRFIGRIFGQQGTDISTQFISALADPVERALANNINEMLDKHSADIVGNLITQESGTLLSTPMKTLFKDRDEDIRQATDSIVALYVKLIKEQLPKILSAINISKIIENRINEMDMAEAERLIFDVMDKELKAIIWLGAGLGFIMGFINCLL